MNARCLAWPIGLIVAMVAGATTAAATTPSGFSVVAGPSGVDSPVAYDVGAAADGEAWIVGETPAGPLIEHWDGSAWGTQPMPSDVTHATLLAVDVVSKTSVFAAGRRNHVAQSNGLLIHWDGQTWMTLPSPKASLDIIQLSARSDTDVYALSQARFDSLGCKRWDVDHWDGVAWTRIARYTSVCGAEPSFTDLLAVPAGPLLVTGQTPQVQPVADCYQQHCPTTAFPWMGGNGQGWISDADGSSKSDIWLIGNSTRMVVDHWGGTTWSTTLGDTYPTAHQVNAIAEISPSEAWLVGTRETSTGGWRTLILHDQAGVLTDLGGPNVGTGDNRLIAIAHVPGTASEMWAIGAAGTAGQVILHHS